MTKLSEALASGRGVPGNPIVVTVSEGELVVVKSRRGSAHAIDYLFFFAL